jgi:hypothetical protein
MNGQPIAPSEQIVVNADPRVDQMAALLRQILLILAAGAGAFGYAGWAGKFSALLVVVGPLAAVIVTVWGQLKTRSVSTKAAAMASFLPDHIATTK